MALGIQEGISEMKLNDDLVHSNEKEKMTMGAFESGP